MFFIEVSYELILHFFVNQFKRHSFFQSLSELFGLVFDKMVLLLNLFLDVLHVRLDLIDILDLLLS